MSHLRMTTPATRAKSPRFTLKWNNGKWKVFDQVRYEDRAAFNLEVEARDALDDLNGVPKKARTQH